MLQAGTKGRSLCWVPGRGGNGWLVTPVFLAPLPSETSPLCPHTGVIPGPSWPSGRMADPFLHLGFVPLQRWWASALTVVNPQFPACLKKCEFPSLVAQPSPRPFLTHLPFVLRPGKYFRLEGLREVFQPLMALLSQNPREIQG